MIQSSELIEIIRSLGGKTNIEILKGAIGTIKKMPLENEHVARVIKVLEENPQDFSYDVENSEWCLVSDDKSFKTFEEPKPSTYFGTQIEKEGFDKAYEFISHYFSIKEKENGYKPKTGTKPGSITCQFDYKGEEIGCVFYSNAKQGKKGMHASVEFKKGYFDKTKYYLTEDFFEDREEHYKDKAKNGKPVNNENPFSYKIFFKDFDAHKDIIEDAVNSIIKEK